jgi:hypothetical protein
VLHFGDISYAVGYSNEWEEYMQQIEPIAKQVPWMVGIGNHERNCICVEDPAEYWMNGGDSGGECGVPYMYRFRMPPPSLASSSPLAADGADTYGESAAAAAATAAVTEAGLTPVDKPMNDTPWYSFTQGSASVIVMSTEHDFSTGSAQYLALESMLQAADTNRADTPFIIFCGHRPMYVDSAYFSPSMKPLQQYIEPLLVEYGVDLALWGHHHSYQRSCAMVKGTCVAAGSGVVHAVIGSAGYELSRVGDEPAKWALFRQDQYYGFARIEVDASSLSFKFLRADTEEVVDSVVLGPKAR